MSQEYRIGSQTYRVVLGSEEGGSRQVTIIEVTEAGEEAATSSFLARLSPLEDDTYMLSLDGRIHLACSASLPEGEEVFVGGESHLVVPPEKISRRRSSGAQEAEKYVTPPMPGVVIKIMAKVGDKVEKGQGVVVISAMKMETTLSSPRSGIVTSVNTEVDAQVKPGDVLIEVDEQAEESG